MTSTQTIRQGLEGVIELLIAMLDTLDGDENLEDTDEDRAVDDDRCDECDCGDDEPWLAGHPTWGHAVDLELDPAELGEPEAGI
ncbi:MAG: hypothetical protein IBJ07_05845 [Rhizobiaceae bacterium]|nr:hypothetical protein [Rhizobiaceae bacterium]